jgi:hypothetical protein
MKLGGVWGAVNLGLFIAATVGTVGLTVSLVPALGDPALQTGAVALLVSLWTFGAAMGVIVFTLRKLEREP